MDIKNFSFMVVCMMLLIGCAVSIAKRSQPVQIAVDSYSREQLVLMKDIQLSLPDGLSMRALERGSTWVMVGSIPQGRVYRPVNKVLMIKSGNAHEAYLVIADNLLIGAYLPVEQVLIQAGSPVSLTKKGNP